MEAGHRRTESEAEDTAVKQLKRAIEDRIKGGRPSVARSALAAGGAGLVVGGVVYRLLRR
jgi:hypothetical protein